MKEFNLKVCGMTESQNIRDVESLGVNLMGFIFWPKSKRAVREKPVYLPQQAKRVGVFVDETIPNICSIADDYGLDLIQLHGNESPVYLTNLRRELHQDVRIIKAFNIATAKDLSQTLPYEDAADIFLFDTKGKMVGGNGEKFDWTVLCHYKGDVPFLLSGGIGPDDAGRVREFTHPKCIGIDLNSRFESTPGIKDVQKLKTFLTALVP